MIRLFIVHGYNAYPEKHWFTWLAEQFPHVATTILAMPNASAPKRDAWIKTLQQAIGEGNDTTHIVAHSLGTYATLHYASTAKALGSITLVSAFANELPHLPILHNFSGVAIDEAQIKSIVQQRTVIAAKDDVIVPFTYSEQLAKRINATLITEQTGNHFMQSDGFTTMPLVANLLKGVL